MFSGSGVIHSHRFTPGHLWNACNDQPAAPGADQAKGCTPGKNPGSPLCSCLSPATLLPSTVYTAEPSPHSPPSMGLQVLFPEIYYGKPDTLQCFLTILSLYFMENPASNREQIATLFSNLGGKALQWAATIWEKQGEETQSNEHFKDALKVTLITMVTMQLVDMAETSRKDNWWTTLRLLSNFVSSQPPAIGLLYHFVLLSEGVLLLRFRRHWSDGNMFCLRRNWSHLLSVSTKSSRTAGLAQVPPAARRPCHLQSDKIMDVDFFWVPSEEQHHR